MPSLPRGLTLLLWSSPGKCLLSGGQSGLMAGLQTTLEGLCLLHRASPRSPPDTVLKKRNHLMSNRYALILESQKEKNYQQTGTWGEGGNGRSLASRPENGCIPLSEWMNWLLEKERTSSCRLVQATRGYDPQRKLVGLDT